MVIGKVAGFGLLDIDLCGVMCVRWHVTMRLDRGQKLDHVMTDKASVCLTHVWSHLCLADTCVETVSRTRVGERVEVIRAVTCKEDFFSQIQRDCFDPVVSF